ncbi:AMP-dependent synthetase [Azoarcus sp. DD4]|uniref:AMP-binding protein n=1 Tax=Azoarcus sp. DD4 TaxID=2027405 RepID=UPI0011275ADB|nr:AMP-binding protein [Azoarcus sp. DD4]QDF97003.1 AMP-dependent synthetase [Azoarcus sp. DD4]
MDSIQSFHEARDFLLTHRTDYDAAYRDFRWPVLNEFNWALDYFDGSLARTGGTALLLVDESGAQTKISFSEMSQRSNQVANFLRALGVKRGDHILIMLGNVVPLWEATLAAIKLGAVVVPTTTLVTPEDLRDRIDRGRIAHILCAAQDTHKFAGLAEGLTRICVGSSADGWVEFEGARDAESSFVPDGVTRATDPLLLYFTSGTTSKPKLVLHTHQSYPVGHLSTMYWLGLKPGDLHYNISSPGWAKHAWSCFFAPWNAGATVFVYSAARFNTGATLDVLTRYGVTSLCAPPTVWRMLIQENLADWPVKLRELASAGEPLNPEVIEQVKRAWGLSIRDGYGQTETTAQVGNPPGQPIRYGSMGRPLPGYRAVLLDTDGQPGVEGELSLPLAHWQLGLMEGYQGDEAKNAEVMRDGHYHTGDVARIDEDGYLWHVGRADDVFKSSDYRISPFELESLLIEHDAVVEAAVVPSPDPVRLSVPKAFVVLRAGSAPDRNTACEIFRFVRDKVAPYKRVRRLEFTDLPKTISGKIRRVELRQKEQQRKDASCRGATEFWYEDFPELT